MTKDKALKMAKESCPYTSEEMRGAFYEGFIKALEEPLPYAAIIAGAIFDFAGFLATREKVIEVGSTADAAPVANLVKEWANKRRLSLDAAAVERWQDVLEAPPNSTTDVVEPVETTLTPQGVPELWFNGKAMYSQPKRDWGGLTQKEALECKTWQDIEAKLREKNT